MIFPQCKYVGVNNAFLLNGHPITDIIHSATQYMIIFDGPERCKVLEIGSSGNGALLKDIVNVKMIADSDRALVYEGQVDLFNRASILHKACQLCDDRINTIVFRGFDNHVTFVQDPSLEELTIIDVYDTSPPEPPKLAYNLRRLEEIGMFGEMMLEFDYHVTDLRQYEDALKTTIFPCHVSGLDGTFLNCLDSEPQGAIKLVGCETTRKAFEARFPSKKYEHVTICPLRLVKPSRPFMLRCCQPDKIGPIEIDGIPGVVVSFVANPPDIYEAVKQLANDIRSKKSHLSI